MNLSSYSTRTSVKRIRWILVFKHRPSSLIIKELRSWCYVLFVHDHYFVQNRFIKVSIFLPFLFEKFFFFFFFFFLSSALFMFSACSCSIWCNLHKLCKICIIIVCIGARTLCFCSHLLETIYKNRSRYKNLSTVILKKHAFR